MSAPPYGDPALKLPVFSRDADPAEVVSKYRFMLRVLDHARAVKAEWDANDESLLDRWGALCVLRWAEDSVEVCRAWMRATARRGGRGLPPRQTGAA